jgi:hypothetical protein
VTGSREQAPQFRQAGACPGGFVETVRQPLHR